MLRFPTSAFVLLAATVAIAAPKPPKLLKLQPFADDLGTKGELSEDTWKALKAVDSCLRDDGLWSSSGEGRTANQIYELAASGVLCWQGASKKVQRAGEQAAPLQRWTDARMKYVEAFRQYIWGIDAKLEGDRKATCTRLIDAARLSGEAQVLAEGLAAAWTLPDAQALATWLDGETRGLGQTISAEAKSQKCE